MKKENILRFVILIISTILLVAVPLYIDLPNKLNESAIRELIYSYGALSSVAFVILTALGDTLFLPGILFSFAAGGIFGIFWGSVLVIIADILSAVATFAFGRSLGKGFAEELIDKKFGSLKKYNDKLEANGFRTILVLRLIPIFPYSGLSLAFALTKVSFRDYFWATFWGVIPGAFLFVILGNSVFTKNLPITIITFILILSLALAAYLFGRKYKEV